MSLDELGINFAEPNANTQIEQADKALHPSAKEGLMALVMKTRVDKNTKVFIDHIMSRAIQRGKFKILMDDSDESKYNAAESLVMADMLTSISVDGLGREDLIKIVTEMPKPHRRLGLFGGGNGSYSDELNG